MKPPSDTTIHIDLVLFLRALTNLVNNAMSYSQSMMPRIVIKLSSEQNKMFYRFGMMAQGSRLI